MGEIVLSAPSMLAFRTFECVAQTVLGKGELRDCTLRAVPYGITKFEYDGSRLRSIDTEGTFKFEDKHKRSQKVSARLKVHDRIQGTSESCKIWTYDDHIFILNRTTHRVFFQNPRAFKVLVADGNGNWEELLLSDEYKRSEERQERFDQHYD